MTHYDCIILGGGPAGATAGAYLAKAGLSVCIVEKTTFPRFHIGESLLPAGNDILREIGVWEQVEASSFVMKRGAEFTYGAGQKRVHIDFRDGLEPGLDYTWQVRRDEFDTILLKAASRHGCTVRQPARIKSVQQTDKGWEVAVAEESGEVQLSASWFLDAGGRGRFLGARLKLPTDTVPLPKRFAVYSHFRGVRRREGEESGNIIIVRVRGGWFWLIPISEELTSVGWVGMGVDLVGGSPQAAFEKAIQESPFMASWMAKAERTQDFWVESDYSFLHQQWAGERWLLLGDAAGFLDPVFSSGVYLAVTTGRDAAQAILASSNGILSLEQQKAYTKQGTATLRTMLQLVCAFYHPRDFSVFLHPKNVFSVVSAVNSVVAGRANLNFSLWWRFQFFRLLCTVNRHVPLVPRLKLE